MLILITVWENVLHDTNNYESNKLVKKIVLQFFQ